MSLDFNTYQEEAKTTALYPNKGEIGGLMYAALGLAGEAGEVCNKVKKIHRDKGGIISREDESAIAAEVSDCLWYIAALCSELQFLMGEVAQANLDKLASRKERNVIGGSGDNR